MDLVACRRTDAIDPVAFIESGRVPTREEITRLQRGIALYLPRVPCETVHHFSDGIYARELRIPAGTLLTGGIHKREQLNIVSKGRITVWTEAGMVTVGAGAHIPSMPGAKRVGLTWEDTVWTTVISNPSNERDLDVLWSLFIEPEEAIPAPAFDTLLEA